MGASDDPNGTSFDEILNTLRSCSIEDVEERSLLLRTTLAKLKTEEWPSIPELALVQLEELIYAGLDGYHQEYVDVIKEGIELQKQLGCEQSEFKPRHRKAAEIEEELNEEGMYHCAAGNYWGAAHTVRGHPGSRKLGGSCAADHTSLPTVSGHSHSLRTHCFTRRVS
jgi:hypothetical protein